MPAKSKAQQRLMQAAEHGAKFPMAKKVQQSMTKAQMHDFAAGSEKGKPDHVAMADGRGKSVDASRFTTESSRYSNRDRRRRGVK